jgi:hypothetical protein
MRTPTSRATLIAAVVAMVFSAAACGNGNGGGSAGSEQADATATRTVTATATVVCTPPLCRDDEVLSCPGVCPGGCGVQCVARTVPATPLATASATNAATPSPTPPLAGIVSGLLVVSRDVTANAGDALGLPPTQPQLDASFDRALSYADWFVDGSERRGVTSSDGRFLIEGLAPGRQSLVVHKSLHGNLVSLRVPFTVGDDGSAQVVAEMSWGQVRSSSLYTRSGTLFREVHGPSGSRLVTQGGRVTEIADPSRSFVDPDGDGHFQLDSCIDQLWRCDAPGQRDGCGPDRFCSCTASCPFCEDCGPGVCVPLSSGLPYVCNEAGVCKLPPYRCNEDGGCAQPSDRCVCVSSCPECDDCALNVCVPDCTPVEITGLSIATGPTQLILGQRASFSATARLSDGTTIDVTHVVDWSSSNATVAVVDSWGTLTALAIGSTAVSAKLGDLASAPWPIEVVERPSLRRIHLQNVSCFYPLGRPQTDLVAPPILVPPPASEILPIPYCRQVVRVGTTIQFLALGEFENGHFEDISDEVDWQVAPSEVGDVARGMFTARQAGDAILTASLDGITSEGSTIRVVTEPTLVALSIYASNNGFAVIDSRLGPDGSRPEPCFECGYTLPVLRGDQLRFHATAEYDTGEWSDVTAEVTWRSSDGGVATIDIDGVMTAVDAGDAAIDAVLGEVASNPVSVRVVNEATLQSIYVYQEGTDRVVAKGDQRFFRATGIYDIGFSRDVTGEVVWRSSDENVGKFDSPGVFTGGSAGLAQVWAELAGRQSDRVSVEVYETSEIDYCDSNRVNRGVWSDHFNRVVLESDCRQYTQPAVVTLRYTVTETQPHGGIFDPCLDLYVFQGNRRIRTLREEGCGDPFVPAAAPGRDEAALKYQLRAFWDLKDESGNPVAPGTYTIHGRFYLYYDPVVSIDIVVLSPDGQPSGRADLVPTGVHGPRCSVVNCTPRQLMQVCVSNRGDAATGPFLVAVSNAQPVRFAGLAVAAEQCVDTPFVAAGTVVVDAGDDAVESDEGNNVLPFTLPTPVPTACDFAPTGCTPRVTPTPTPSRSGGCFIGSSECAGTSRSISREACCELVRSGALPGVVSWCSPDQTDPATGRCAACGDPCRGIPTPTPIVECCPPDQACIPELPPCTLSCCPPNARCTPEISPCQPCAGIAGLPCPPGRECIDDPTDDCDPGHGGADCGGLCVPAPSPCGAGEDCLRCAGFLGLPCPDGYLCIDDPNDSCDPAGGGADCGGLCILDGSPQCRADSDCPAVRAPCQSCPDGSEACPRSFCENGSCRVVFETCAGLPPTPTPISEGFCYRGPVACGGGGVPWSQAGCCVFAQQQASALPVFWCPADSIDQTTGECQACTGNPCEGITTPTPFPS